MSRGHRNTQKTYRHALEIMREQSPELARKTIEQQRAILRSLVREHQANKLPAREEQSSE